MYPEFDRQLYPGFELAIKTCHMMKQIEEHSPEYRIGVIEDYIQFKKEIEERKKGDKDEDSGDRIIKLAPIRVDNQ
jgi:hypothetical protein